MSQTTVGILSAVFGGIVAAVVGFVGVWFGVRATSAWQHKHCILHNMRSYYRKLLTTLTDCGSKFVHAYTGKSLLTSQSVPQLVAEPKRRASNIIYNRLFIYKEIDELDVAPRWGAAVDALERSFDTKAFTASWDGILSDVRTVALKEFYGKS